jgi:ankyrin repeat protein
MINVSVRYGDLNLEMSSAKARELVEKQDVKMGWRSNLLLKFGLKSDKVNTALKKAINNMAQKSLNARNHAASNSEAFEGIRIRPRKNNENVASVGKEIIREIENKATEELKEMLTSQSFIGAGNYRKMAELIRNGADPLVKSEGTPFTALHAAVKFGGPFGQEEVFKAIRDQGRLREALCQESNGFGSPLNDNSMIPAEIFKEMVNTLKGDSEALKAALLQKTDGSTVMHEAVSKGMTEHLKNMIDVLKDKPEVLIEALTTGNSEGQTPIDLASDEAKTILQEALYDARAKLIEVETELTKVDANGNTPLHLIAENGEALAVVVNKFKDNPEGLAALKAALVQKNDEGNTPLHLVGMNKENLKIMVDVFKDDPAALVKVLTEPNGKGETPIDSAWDVGTETFLKDALIDAKATVALEAVEQTKRVTQDEINKFVQQIVNAETLGNLPTEEQVQGLKARGLSGGTRIEISGGDNDNLGQNKRNINSLFGNGGNDRPQIRGHLRRISLILNS